MPFTAAHPAFIVPLLRLKSRWFSATGLIVGSIAPDFAYFLPYDGLSKLSHSLKGLLLFNLPMALALAVVFHLLVREQVIQNLPAYFRNRALSIKPVKLGAYLFQNWHIFAISALIGAFTHLFWDSFTHYSGYFVRNNTILLRPVSQVFLELPLARVLQHTSTFVGFAILLWHINRLPVTETKSTHWLSWIFYWIQVGFIGSVIMLLNLPARFHLSGLERLVVPYLTGVLMAVILLAVIRKVRLLLSGAEQIN